MISECHVHVLYHKNVPVMAAWKQNSMLHVHKCIIKNVSLLLALSSDIQVDKCVSPSMPLYINLRMTCSSCIHIHFCDFCFKLTASTNCQYERMADLGARKAYMSRFNDLRD